MATGMTVPLWVLLAFAAWTLLVLAGSIGVYRWSRILTGRATVAEWRADVVQGSDGYQRAMRAHLNCVENLPVYGAVAVVAAFAGIDSPHLDTLALAFIGARVAQSVVHIAWVQTERVATLRFGLFFVQIACVATMAALIAVGR